MLSLIVPYFLVGMVSGFVLSFLWEIHRIGKLIMIVLCVASVGYALLNASELIAGLNVWHIELPQFIGIIVGNTASKRIMTRKRTSSL